MKATMHTNTHQPPVHSPPPRSISSGIYLKALFATGLTQFGLLFGGFGLLFVYIFLPQTQIPFIGLGFGDVAVQTGIVIDTHKTSSSINDQRVYAIKYTFSPPAGMQKQGTSYSVGLDHHAGQKVEIKYLVNNPSQSTIIGYRHKTFPGFAMFVLIFPLIGFGLASIGLRKGLKRTYLLRMGKLATATFQSKTKTNVSINDKVVYRFEFDFEDQQGHRCQALAESTNSTTWKTGDQELVLFDTDNPFTAVLFGQIPGRLTFGHRGRIQSKTSFVGLVFSLLIPSLVLLELLWISGVYRFDTQALLAKLLL